MSAALKIKHPHITQKKGVCGGRPTITGTRIPVWSVAGWSRQGYSAEKIQCEIYPSLGLAQISDALSYYYDYKEVIDQQIEENSLPPRERQRRQAQWRQARSL